ncbi:MAG: right-handed parallel beta-helix repeat-containing protein [Gammaproteobacteria bacterium]|nr:right-handed parallel beta-helix repeat-containing protein [Gammaproteobacteria bacterium]
MHVIDDCDNCTVKITRNLITDVQWYGVWLWQTDMNVVPSSYLVSQNTIQTTDTADAIFLEDLPTTQVVVSKNNITMNSTWGGIGGANVPEVLVANNKVNGIGLNGIWAIGAADWTLVGNNVNSFTAVSNWWTDSFGYPVGPIALYESIGFTIVGGNNKSNVVWTGGGGHIFTGVNNMQYAGLGQSVSDAMAQKRDIRKTMP